MSDETKELSEIEGLNDELRDRMAPHLRALADRYDRPIPRMGYAPPVLTADRAVMREAAQSVECLRAEVLRLQSALAADPLRAMLPDVVAAMEYALSSLDRDTDRLLKGDYYGAGIKALAKLDEFRWLLSKLRTLTPNEGGKDDGEE